jgi:hypothetical protein
VWVEGQSADDNGEATAAGAGGREGAGVSGSNGSWSQRHFHQQSHPATWRA